MQGGMPKKEQIEEFTKSYERVNKQIAQVDDSFFDGVVTLMGVAGALVPTAEYCEI